MTKTKTIGNPLSWSADLVGEGMHQTEVMVDELAAIDNAPIKTRSISMDDIRTALRLGKEDFLALRTDVLWMVIIYPIAGFVLTFVAATNSLIPLIFPLLSGFALLGPVVGIGLYEMSRRREMGIKTDWRDGLKASFSTSSTPMVVLGAYLLGIFAVWLVTAFFLYSITLGPEMPTSVPAFLDQVFSTAAGWTMLILGLGIGFLFAVVVLITSLVSFPMLVDRRVGLPRAVATSVKISRENPVTVAIWGLIVAVGLAIGFATLFVGMIFILPILGHATWHLYRRAVVPVRRRTATPSPTPDAVETAAETDAEPSEAD